MNTFLDDSTKHNIELDYVLDKIEVCTPYGKELRDNMKPFSIDKKEQLIDELNKIEVMIKLIKENKFFFKNIKRIFSHIKDIRNSIQRSIHGYTLSNVELYEVKNFILTLKELNGEIKEFKEVIPHDVYVERIRDLEKTFDPQDTNIKTFYIYDEYSQDLRLIREEKKDIAKKLKLEKIDFFKQLEKELGISIRPDGSIVISKDSSDLIEKVSKHPHAVYSSETYMSIKYSISSTALIDSLEKDLEALKEREEAEEIRIRKVLSDEIAAYSNIIFDDVNTIARLDFLMAKAYMAIDICGIKPELVDDHVIQIVAGRHLKIEDNLKIKGESFTPISLSISEGVTCITGANMGGKTVSLKLVGLLCVMVQYGLFVPCESMTMGLHGFVYGSIGDMQSTDNGLSTFGAEIRSIQGGLKRAEERGVILIDELARGTNPDEGYALSKAIVNYLNTKNSITILTTHYDNIANSEEINHLQVVGLANVDYDILREQLSCEKGCRLDLITKHMDYRLIQVNNKSKVPRDAINIARLMGLKEEILKEAEQVLSTQN